MTDILKEIRPLLVIFLGLAIITGLIYPLAVYIIGQAAFPYQANGSLLTDKNGTVTGSELIGQQFTDDRYFWPRPSYTGGYPYNSLASSGSNYGPTNEKLISDITIRTDMIRQTGVTDLVPSDLVMGSASGLDPDISLEAALIQVPRVAQARGIDTATVARLVGEHTKKPVFGLLGESTVNVLTLNLALDKL